LCIGLSQHLQIFRLYYSVPSHTKIVYPYSAIENFIPPTHNLLQIRQKKIVTSALTTSLQAPQALIPRRKIKDAGKGNINISESLELSHGLLCCINSSVTQAHSIDSLRLLLSGTQNALLILVSYSVSPLLRKAIVQQYRAMTIVYDSLTQFPFSDFVCRLKCFKARRFGSWLCFRLQLKRHLTW
jgi:hypothetical protein